MTDFRALCAELLDAYAYLIDRYMTAPSNKDALVYRARAALAQPEPAELTDEEVKEEWYRLPGESLQDVVAFARTVIAADRARWGTPANTINQEGYEGRIAQEPSDANTADDQ
jgi:hypothetical protein